tara:strand:+ start:1168 stop:1371 length:204 start_codon:yes stop_codon:yes gene_type:complete
MNPYPDNLIEKALKEFNQAGLIHAMRPSRETEVQRSRKRKALVRAVGSELFPSKFASEVRLRYSLHP